MRELWQLFISFARIGAMTFGGGPAMLPMLQRELVDNRGWVEEEELMDYYAIGQCTPGIIAVNTATFVGYKRRGDIGGVFATAGIVFPSVVIILILAAAISTMSDIAWVQNAFAGIRACVCVQIFNAVRKLVKKAVVDRWTAGIFAVVLALSVLTELSPVLFVVCAAAAGILLKLWEVKGK